jgi:hypothetical protein
MCSCARVLVYSDSRVHTRIIKRNLPAVIKGSNESKLLLFVRTREATTVESLHKHVLTRYCNASRDSLIHARSIYTLNCMYYYNTGLVCAADI